MKHDRTSGIEAAVYLSSQPAVRVSGGRWTVHVRWLRRVVLCFVASLWSAAGSMPLYGGEPASRTKPNILVLFLDDVGLGDLACYGAKDIATPHLDQVAREGIRFTQFYVAAPICSASRCGLITGQYPACWRIHSFLQTRSGNRACGQADFLDPAAPSYVRALQQAGYATAHVGKWHLGGGRDVSDAPPFSAYGYDFGWGTYESPQPAAPLGLKTTPWGTQLEPQQVPRHERTRWMVDQTLTFIRENGQRAWLVNLWLDDLHTPFRPSAEQRAQAKQRGQANAEGPLPLDYRAVLEEMDRQIGRLLDGLAALGQDERTLLIVAGDNGPEPTYDRRRTLGLRGMKWSLYEGGIRTPLLVRWKGVLPSGLVNDMTVIAAIDLFPTLLALAKLPPPDSIRFDGEDLSAAFRGQMPRRTTPLFWQYGRPTDEAIPGPVQGFPYPREPLARSPTLAVRDGNWKLLMNPDGSGVELYDLARDPREEHNLAPMQPEVVRRLAEQLAAWRTTLP